MTIHHVHSSKSANDTPQNARRAFYSPILYETLKKPLRLSVSAFEIKKRFAE